MRKICTLILIFALTSTTGYGAFFKKDDNSNVDTSQGYVGKLPDLTKEYKPSGSRTSPPIFDTTQEFHSENAIKPIPRDDPAFVNIILKKDKASPYINELQEFIDMLEQIYDAIENKDDVQYFNAKVYFLNMSTEYFKEKYENKPESSYVSFKQLMKVSNEAKEVSVLRAEAEKYKRYLAYTDTGYQYSANNIDMAMFNLKLSVEKAINILKNTK
jgi:hypothetical protein